MPDSWWLFCFQLKRTLRTTKIIGRGYALADAVQEGFHETDGMGDAMFIADADV